MADTYKLKISYDGTDFHGWQRQPGKRTIQGSIESALTKITRKEIPVIGSGRTDAGVHALGQTAHFRALLKLNKEDLHRALNALLPSSIRIISVNKTDDNFHAIKSARSKIYQYRIHNAREISPFVIRYVLYWTQPLDVTKMKQAAALFIRKADFTAFSSNRLYDPVREVFSSEIKKKGKEIIYTVEANGFLRYMVRTMVGTLLEAGKGQIPPDQVDMIFRENHRSLAGPTAPAKGLCLLKVNY